MLNGTKMNIIELNDEGFNRTFEWINNPDINRGLGSKHPVSKSEHEKWFEKTSIDKVNMVFLIQDRETQKIIGLIGNRETDLVNKICSIFVYIGDQKFRGKGLAKEAVSVFSEFLFYQNNIRKIQAWIYEYNISSKKMFESLGFKQEALMQEHWYREGKYHNIFVYFKTREEK